MSALCKGTTKAGNPCKAKPLTGSDYCRQHQIVERVEKEPEPVKEIPVFKVCGHQNLHYTGSEPLTCDLPPGHDGPHEADFHAVNYRRGAIESEEMTRTAWGDEAGVPANQIKPDYESLAELMLKRKIEQEARNLEAQA